jgi:crossover junction endodeoxyribonuclease RuvC
MIILGIDPGLAITGFGLISSVNNQFKVIQYGVIRTDSKLGLPDRLVKIQQGLNTLISQYKPDAVAIEELFFNTNAKSAFWSVRPEALPLSRHPQQDCLFSSTRPSR